MCECPSTSPGVSVVPGRSITFAPAAATLASAPTASMRSPFTRTAQPSCIVSPSNTRAGFSTVTVWSALPRPPRPWADGHAIESSATAAIGNVFRMPGL